jgi:glyoxylase-like metal-dependent hydrolase (beta-lactamase superfamily II)
MMEGALMSVQIHPISTGFVHMFLIKGEQTVLIDAGMPGRMEQFIRGLALTNTRPEDINLLLITHGHYDHIGLAKKIVELSGAKTAIHQREVDWVQLGEPPLPPGVTLLGKLLIGLMKWAPRITVPSTRVDIVLGDDGLTLDEYGIPGRVVYTPGHTMGSVSVLLENGDAIVGDLAGSARYMQLKPGMPIFAEQERLIKPSWKKLLDLGAQMIYPAHGKPFSADALRKQIT